jgi:hypothetical protein
MARAGVRVAGQRTEDRVEGLEIVLVAVVLAAVATWFEVGSGRWRWGSIAEPPAVVGDDPYRTMVVAGGARPRHVPALCIAASFTSIAWGMVTMLMFAPGGLMFLLCGYVSHPAAFPGGLLVLMVSLHGFVIGARLIAISRALVVRSAGAAVRARSVAVRSLAHHGGVAAAFALVAVVVQSREMDQIAVQTAWLCGLGAGLALLVLLAGRKIARVDAAEAAAIPRSETVAVKAGRERR